MQLLVNAERRAQLYLEPYYNKRRAILKTIPKFWPQALANLAGTMLHLQHAQDQDALSYLEDIWVSRDKTEPRCFTLEFVSFALCLFFLFFFFDSGVQHFKSNPYFSDEVLIKEFKYLPPSTADDTPNADGVTPSMLEFDWEQHVAPQAIKINWKDDSKNLTKLFGRTMGEEGDDMPAEPGSFFNFFEYADDPFDVSYLLVVS